MYITYFYSMIKLLSILWNSFKMALQELRVNKLRTFLSLFGITIGIFCIIGVLATVDSLKRKIKGEIESLGSNTIYIQKQPWGGGDDYPWWKYQKRPDFQNKELEEMVKRSKTIGNAAFINFTNSNISFKDQQLSGVTWYCVTNDFNIVQPINISYGRYLSYAEFENGTPNIVMGYTNALNLFGNPEFAIGKTVNLGKIKGTIVGVTQKEGTSLLGGWSFDEAIVCSYRFARNVISDNLGGGFIMLNGKPNIPVEDLKADVAGALRNVRKLTPKEEDNFALNDISSTSQPLDKLFGQVNIGGWAIAGLSLIVGAFGVANIMFVTVRERTSQIGLKKALGAKRSTILTEFLIESAFLCIIGGLVGLALVWLLAQAASAALPFPIFIAPNIIGLALSICIVLGILSGIIPASIASKMDPVVAIRTK